MQGTLSQDRGDAAPGRRRNPRRVRVAESVYQRVDRDTGKAVAGKYEFTYRDVTGRQVWQTAKGDTKADAKAERAELLAHMHKGERVERTDGFEPAFDRALASGRPSVLELPVDPERISPRVRLSELRGRA